MNISAYRVQSLDQKGGMGPHSGRHGGAFVLKWLPALLPSRPGAGLEEGARF